MSSPDLVTWTGLHDAMPQTPAWAWSVAEGGEFWAPTVAQYGDTYRIYFGGRHRSAPVANPGWCIGYASATSPAGPFVPAARPMLCQVTDHQSPALLSTSAPSGGRGVFDPQIYQAPNGSRYMHFKANDNPYQLWAARLNSTGTGFATPGFGLFSVDDQAPIWEYSSAPDHQFTILENPTMDFNPYAHAHYGVGYYLYYSGGDWRTSDYGTGLAVCRSPTGPCLRATSGAPWLASRGSAGGPGGLSVFRDLQGETRVAYHTWARGQPISNGRRLHVEPLAYDGRNPILRNRRPTGSVVIDLDPAAVTVSGTVRDPDVALPVEVTLTVDGVPQGTATTDEAFAVSFPEVGGLTEGDHQVCLRALDDNGLGSSNAACRTVDVPPAGGPDPTFSDVSWRHPFFADVEWMVTNAISTGFSDLTYRPAGSVTRQAMSAFMFRLAGSPSFTPPVAPSFPDVPTAHPFFAEIEWLASEGVTTGFANGTFRPVEAVTRQSMSAFMFRLAGAPAFVVPGSGSFLDVPPTHPFFAEVEWMAAASITTGFSGGMFKPSEAVTRQAMSAFMHRLADGPGVGL